MSDQLPDKEIEKLFQKGSELYDFEYNPEAWERMEVILNKRKRRRLLIWWISGLFAIAIVVAAGLSIDFSEQGSLNDAKSKMSDRVEQAEVSSDRASSNTLEAQMGQIEQLQDDMNDSGAGKEVVSSTSSEFFESPTTDSFLGQRTAITREAGINHESEIKIVDSNQLEEDHTSGQHIIIEEGLTNPNDQVFNADRDFLNRLWMLPVTGVTFAMSNSMPESIHGAEQPNDDDEVEKSTALILGLSLGLSSSSAGTMGYSDFDLQYGIFIQSFVSSRWAIGVGANYIEDSYMAGKYDYKLEYGYWPGDVSPDYTDAVCKMISLPISATYVPKGFSNSGFFFGGGISSLIMVRENYVYNYEEPQPEYRKYWSGDMENKDWFSMLDLSVGYQYIFKNKTIIRFTPHIQVPLRGIGHGNVMLKNYGFSIHYGFRVK